MPSQRIRSKYTTRMTRTWIYPQCCVWVLGWLDCWNCEWMHELAKEGKKEVGVPKFCGMILFLTPLQTGWGHTPCLSKRFERKKPPFHIFLYFSQYSVSKLLTRNAGLCSRLSGRALNRAGLFCTLRPAIPNLEWAFAPPYYNMCNRALLFFRFSILPMDRGA